MVNMTFFSFPRSLIEMFNVKKSYLIWQFPFWVFNLHKSLSWFKLCASYLCFSLNSFRCILIFIIFCLWQLYGIFFVSFSYFLANEILMQIYILSHTLLYYIIIKNKNKIYCKCYSVCHNLFPVTITDLIDFNIYIGNIIYQKNCLVFL